MLTFDLVTECFDRVYTQLREDRKENAPSSYTWFAPTLYILERCDRDDIRPTVLGWRRERVYIGKRTLYSRPQPSIRYR